LHIKETAILNNPLHEHELRQFDFHQRRTL